MFGFCLHLYNNIWHRNQAFTVSSDPTITDHGDSDYVWDSVCTVSDKTEFWDSVRTASDKTEFWDSVHTVLDKTEFLL